MRHKSFKANLCPVARSLDTIGEWWSLLIVRDALFGVRRFSDFQKSLGLAKNVLSTRLKKLVASGVMEQVPASDGSAYQEYALTQKGRELLPVLVALRQWGESYLFSRGEKRLQVLDKRTRKPPRLEVQNAKGEQRFPGSEQMLELQGGPGPLRRNSDPSLRSRLNRKIATGGGIWLFRRVS
jgi:DNA-binding HxlR family transcriptional regulator